MTQEDKKLLLADLCARLPYGVVVNTPKGDGHLCSINQTLFGNEYGVNIKATRRDYFNGNECDIKPYLRPMSSMTEEEREYYNNHLSGIITGIDAANFMIWIYSNHLDIFHLIEKGLAIEVTEENNLYKVFT